MKKGQKIIYSMLESFIDKSINEIRINPRKGVMSLLDLGVHFSTSNLNYLIIQIQEELKKPENNYYFDLIIKFVSKTDDKIIKTLTINLFYHSFNVGMNKIKNTNLPWLISLDYDNVDQENVRELLDEGERLGIFTYMLIIENKENLNNIFNFIKNYEDNTFILLTKPTYITNEIINEIKKYKNIILLLEIKDMLNNEYINHITKKLTDIKLFYAAYLNEETINNIKSLEEYSYNLKNQGFDLSFNLKNDIINNNKIVNYLKPMIYIDIYYIVNLINKTFMIKNDNWKITDNEKLKNLLKQLNQK